MTLVGYDTVHSDWRFKFFSNHMVFIINAYCINNGIFTAEEFRTNLETNEHMLFLCGAVVHHQNAID